MATSLLTQADVAQLAGVRRPVVTVWRKRYADAAAGPAFPPAVASVEGVERFERDAVVAWLRATGRGNNERVVREAPLHSAPPVATAQGYRLACALVVLAGLTGHTLAGFDPDDLVSLAEDADREDRCLLREVAGAAAHAEADLLALAPYVDALLAASYGPLDALERLAAQADRFGLTLAPSPPPPEVRRLVLTLASALAEPVRRDRPATPVPLVDPLGAGDLLPKQEEEWPDGVALPASARAAWLRLLATDVLARVWTPAEEDSQAPAILIAALPARSGTDAASTWDLIDEVVRELSHGRRAIIVGPASLLVDALADQEAVDVRDYVLRHGTLRAALRLGASPAPAQPRERLGLWVLGVPSAAVHEAYRRTAVADLAGLDLDTVRDDFVADVLAAVDDVGTELRGEVPDAAQTAESRAHAFRIARYELTSDVRARPALVPRLARAATRAAGADARAQSVAKAAVERVRPAVAGVSIELAPSPSARAGGAVGSVAELLSAGRLRLIPGLRLAPGLARVDAAGPPVVGPGELGGPESRWGARRVELLALTAAHPRATLTDPGDVVFATTPQVAASVDALGGSIVEFPARVLRVMDDASAAGDRPVRPRPQRILPRVLAADLLRAPGKEWRAAPVRLVPTDAAEALAAALDAAHSAREAALARAADLAALTDLLADGVVAGAYTTTAGPHGGPDQEGH